MLLEFDSVFYFGWVFFLIVASWCVFGGVGYGGVDLLALARLGDVNFMGGGERGMELGSVAIMGVDFMGEHVRCVGSGV